MIYRIVDHKCKLKLLVGLLYLMMIEEGAVMNFERVDGPMERANLNERYDYYDKMNESYLQVADEIVDHICEKLAAVVC